MLPSTIDSYKQTIPRVAIYVRLSRDDLDNDNDYSKSIKNQKEYLSSYVLEKGWNLVEIYIDDGFSGTTFDRPAFKKMLQDAEAKKIDTIVIKDLSRFGRNYIDVGIYLERYFPSKGIRYILVDDHFDSDKDCIDELIEFKSLVNGFYPRDISRKVRSVMDNKRKNGQFIGAFAPYGYKKDPNNKNKLIIDEDTAPIVKRIFDLYINGNGYKTIAVLLNSEKVPSPLMDKSSRCNYQNPRSKFGLWGGETIRRILTTPTYAGNITQHRDFCKNFKEKKRKSLPKSDWIIVNNTHEAIIEQELFDIVQNLIESKVIVSDTPTKKHSHLLAGLLFCGDCGERMTYTRSHGKGASYAICSKYKRFSKEDGCTRHAIKEEDLINIVINDLKNIAKKAVDEDKLLKIALSKPQKTMTDSNQNEIKKTESRLNEIDRAKFSSYDDKSRGILSEDDFISINNRYNEEIEQLKTKLNRLKEDKLRREQVHQNYDILKEVQKIASFENVNSTILSKLIEKVLVLEDNRIKVLYKFPNPY